MSQPRVVNSALSRAMVDARVRDADVAARLGVDPKTVRRWIGGRVPQPGHRRDLARLLERHEYDLWPALARELPIASEIKSTYAHRGAVPRAAWLELFGGARTAIDVLAYSALFLMDDVELIGLIRDRAAEGVVVRLVLGDPESPHVAQRGMEEGIGYAMAAKVRNALILSRSLDGLPSVEIRVHDTVLYSSIYRGDDAMLVNPHLYGLGAACAPMLKLVGQGDMSRVYAESFERVWASARPLAAVAV
jgi:hypothetical protein